MRSYVKARITFFSYEEGGRPVTPVGDGNAPYIREKNNSNDDLEVRIYSLPKVTTSGEEYDVQVELCYHPEIDYSNYDIETEFYLIEGPKIIGQGIILSERYEK